VDTRSLSSGAHSSPRNAISHRGPNEAGLDLIHRNC
jgi:hypothetical protein